VTLVPTSARPEVLAPAGTPEALRAAVRAGADAVYFGLQAFNARARAQNFDDAALGETMADLHANGVRGYVTLNTLVFDRELDAVEQAIRRCASAGVDAVIVQDFAVARMVRAIAPGLPIHASTQTTCTDAGAVELARSLGAARVILARELSLDDIAAIRSQTDVDLEVFVHGALCIAYSGQCLTSEAIGGRSANRGACAQACRLPYDLLVDGVERDVGERAYLLSPEDLVGAEAIPLLVALGIRSLKIEGRLKSPEYVAATTRLYRQAVDHAVGAHSGDGQSLRDAALQTYSRGSGPGFLLGVDHQRLVEGRSCDHRGTQVGVARERMDIGGRYRIRVDLDRSLSLGDGILVEGGKASDGEIGGRVWSILVHGDERPEAAAGEIADLWLGPDVTVRVLETARRVWRTNDPALEREVRRQTEDAPHRIGLHVEVAGEIGSPPSYRARTDRGASAEVVGDALIERARSDTRIDEVLRDKLGRLGDTAYELRTLESRVPAGSMIPPGSINRARRALVDALAVSSHPALATTSVHASELLAAATPPSAAPPASGVFVLCRSLAQAEAAVDAGADGVYLDFLDLTGTGRALRQLRARGAACVGVAPPRIRKPGEEKIDRYLQSLEPDMVLVRALGPLREVSSTTIPAIGDFSLNVTNRVSAREVLSLGLTAFTPSFDLDATQLTSLLDGPLGPWAEVVVHHPMPLFHMEHCVIAALLSEGHSHVDCGRPCDRHQVSLRDRSGVVHPVEADVGCRNTVFHGSAQSAAGVVSALQRSGVRRFRIELVRESNADVTRIVQVYRALLAGKSNPARVWEELRADGNYGVVRGSLRVIPG